MKVLLIVPPPPAPVSGNQQTSRRLAEGLARRGHEVVVATPDEAISRARGGEQACADVVHVYHAIRAATPFDFTACGAAPRPARVVTFAGSDLPGVPLARERRAVIADEVARADAAMVAFVQQRDAVAREWPALAGRIHVVSKGVIAPRGDFPLRQRLGFDGDERIALLVAGVRPVKGNRRAVEWFRDVVSQESRARLVLLGPELDREEGRALRALLATTPWAWWLGAIAPDAMAGAYAAADAVINVSDYEGQSNALLEALALGRPVVARDVPGNHEWLRDGEQALLFRERGDFVPKVVAALRRDAAAMAVAARGPAWIAEHHAPEREIEQVEALYAAALAHRDATRRAIVPRRPEA